MKLAVPANYDLGIVSELARYPIDEIYGKLPVDGVSGGRPSYMGSRVSWKSLEEYVSALSTHGIAFNYLLNGACFSNREWTQGWQKKLMRLLERLDAIGIRRLTVSTPFLLQLIKSRTPQFRVKVGIYAQVDTPRRAKYWEELGADAINLESFSINRNFGRLGRIRQAVRCELQLIVNHPCLPNCPMQPYHMAGTAHASDGSRTLYLDYCFMQCTLRRLSDPSMLIKAGWIRPEDLRAYEKIGYATFKLLERGIPSEDVLKRVRAYSEHRFDGNLAELVLPYGFRKPLAKRKFWTLRHFLHPLKLNPLRLRRFRETMKSQGMLFAIERLPIQIDSAAIPADFLNGFRHRECEMTDCAECGYCEGIAARAVHIEEAFRDESLRRIRSLEQEMIQGRMWNV